MGKPKQRGAFGKARSRREEEAPAAVFEPSGEEEQEQEGVTTAVWLSEDDRVVVDVTGEEQVLERVRILSFPLVEVRGWQWRRCAVCGEDTRHEIHHPLDLEGGLSIECPSCGAETRTKHSIIGAQLVFTELRAE